MNDDQQQPSEQSQNPSDSPFAQAETPNDQLSQDSASFDQPVETAEVQNTEPTDSPFSEPAQTPVEPVAQPAEFQPAQQVVEQETPVYAAQPVAPVGIVPQNPGQTLGIVSIVLGVLAMWVIGLPLAIVSMVKSSKANAPKTLGIVGLVLNILGIFVSGLIMLAVLAAYQGIQERANEIQSSSDAASLVAADTISLSEDYKPTTGIVTFAQPLDFEGWTATTVDKDGVNEYTKNDDSASFTTYQGTLTGMTGTDRQVTQTAMSEYITQLDATEVAGSESTESFALSSGKWLEFETKQVTLTADGQNLEGIVAVRMYEGYELSVVYLASADSFSLGEWFTLANNVQIYDGEV